MRKGILGLTAAAAALSLGLTACGGDGGTGGDTSASGGASAPAEAKPGKIGVILPDSKSSARWETADRKYLQEAFEAAGVAYDIQNAQGDKTAFQTIADQMITNGATVLVIVNLDSGTGKAVLDKAKSQGVATIDYDRLTLGGSASYYVSFDNVKVGTLQGEGLVKCLTDKKAEKPIVAELNGSPTDNNATLFKQGYDGVLQPKYDSGDYTKGPDQSVPDWDNAKGGQIFEQMLTSEPKIAGVLAANDGLGNAAITVLKKQKLNGKVPVTGQDATVEGLQNILAGDQCMTVYKAIKKEADATAELAIALAKGEKPNVSGSVKDPEGNRDVPSVLLDPQPIYFDSVKDVVADGYVAKEDLCKGDFADKCTEAGVQ
ncbi:substrate-binding domain-containing protein [Sphaerisporangium rubeum]|uniref:D-xylose transport system substrate-binding protein n=1 Tax=Sphaerisporangium rubeum TaxID=321317 RepID=A0A7X0ICP7_9ACTN|nr:substrate-binding domain-containing protein [Sphaerisporangium rubeum]MBB6472807.1 D-xylose transport system substrate-binding protein [Sphaerisporangium rubeum]